MNKLHKHPLDKVKIADTQKILLVEDNKVNIEIAVDMIETLGFTVDIAINGQQALDLYHGNKYILILMDCVMPVMNGFDTAREIRKIEREPGHVATPIIALTAHAMPEVREECINSGMNDFLGKPFGMPDLHSIMNKWLATSPDESSEHPVFYSGDVEDNNDFNSANNETAILDYEILNKLRKKQKKNNSNLMNRLIDVYLEQSSRLLVELKDATERDDVEAVRMISHTLKSSSVNVGAIGLSELCREVENACEHGQIENSLVQQIHRTFSDVKRAFNDVLGDVNN